MILSGDYQRQGFGGVGEMGEGAQKVETSSYKINVMSL